MVSARQQMAEQVDAGQQQEQAAAINQLVHKQRQEIRERSDSFASLKMDKERLEAKHAELETKVKWMTAEMNAGKMAQRQLREELEQREQELGEDLPNQNKELLEEIENMRRTGFLAKVYREFDLDGGGDVGEDELLKLGRTRRRLGHKQGEWTATHNRVLMRKIGTDENGDLPGLMHCSTE